MLEPFIVVTNKSTDTDTVKVIKRDEYNVWTHEPITGAETMEEAVVLAEQINDIGGAGAWLHSRNIRDGIYQR